MPLQSSGQISIGDASGGGSVQSTHRSIANEYGDSSPHSLSEFNRGGTLVPNLGSANDSIPTTSSNIKMSQFRGGDAGALDNFPAMTGGPNFVTHPSFSMRKDHYSNQAGITVGVFSLTTFKLDQNNRRIEVIHNTGGYDGSYSPSTSLFAYGKELDISSNCTWYVKCEIVSGNSTIPSFEFGNGADAEGPTLNYNQWYSLNSGTTDGVASSTYRRSWNWSATADYNNPSGPFSDNARAGFGGISGAESIRFQYKCEIGSRTITSSVGTSYPVEMIAQRGLMGPL